MQFRAAQRTNSLSYGDSQIVPGNSKSPPRRVVPSGRTHPPRPPPGLCVITVGALVGGVKVRTSPGLVALVGLPPGAGSAPPGPARILASLSATEGPVVVLAALGSVEVGAGGSSRGVYGVIRGWWGLERRAVQRRCVHRRME